MKRTPPIKESCSGTKFFGKTFVLQSTSCYRVIKVISSWLHEKIISYLCRGSNVTFYLFYRKCLLAAIWLVEWVTSRELLYCELVKIQDHWTNKFLIFKYIWVCWPEYLRQFNPFSPMLKCYTPYKRQKSARFSDIFRLYSIAL